MFFFIVRYYCSPTSSIADALQAYDSSFKVSGLFFVVVVLTLSVLTGASKFSIELPHLMIMSWNFEAPLRHKLPEKQSCLKLSNQSKKKETFLTAASM